MSSIAPLVTKQIAAAAEKTGVAMLDAPVSGGEPGAIEGTLAIMVGGSKDIFDRCLGILKVLGRSVIHVGDIGAGGFAKLANQIIVALNIAAISEAFVLAKKAQIEPETLLQAIQSGLAGSTVMNAKLPKIMDGDFKPGFKIRLHYKDIKNVMNTARDLNIPLPLTSIVQQILATLIVDEKGELDHAAIVNFEEKLAHVEVRR
jgi:2-hydroxy-3-oxopropionate reductase